MLSGSFVISLAIAIALNKSPASGFTVARDILSSAPDLETGESKQLEVKYDLKTLNHNKTIFNNKTREDSDSVIAIHNTNNYDEKIYEQQQIVTETTDSQTKISEINKIEIPSESTIIISTETNSFVSTPISQTTGQELSTIYAAETLSTTETEIEYSTITNITPLEEIHENATTTQELQNYTGNITSTAATLDTSTTSNNVNTYGVDKNENNVTSGTTTVADFESKITTKTIFSDQRADQTNANKSNTIAITDGSLDVHTTDSFESKTDATSDSTPARVTTETLTGDFFIADLYLPTLPPWKKYTTIDRKRTSTEDTTITEKDMTRSETAQTRISLENVFINTPIPSLEKLRNDLINAQESTTKEFERTTGVEISVSNSPGSGMNPSTTKMSTEIDTESTKLELVSRRAGYKDNRESTTTKPEVTATDKDNRETTTTKPEATATDKDSSDTTSTRPEATVTKFASTVTMNKTEIYETDVEEGSNKNGSVYGSQSQLADDAIKEELLREEMINDNEENAKFTHLKQVKITDGVSEVVPEDMLSVKPIGQEKKKNTILYAVSPNYKPLKKIEIQPSKQYVRDPDDNSWRNESISSLGIVFKPKNASKSFTEVLKNKTEIELGIMTDKDSKEDLPDLRVRLEKIAEVRKSKKKVNKFGDAVYGDYEESSESGVVSSDTTPMTPYVKSTFTTPPPTQSTSTENDVAVNSISKEKFDLFKTEKISLITTNKPRKAYNLAEYYDTTDEYDGDYINLHDIDLKKFTKAVKPKEDTTQLPEWLRTQPMRDFQPERKATLQYFPPTQKVAQKVNMNKYDTNFERKVNLFDVNKEPPKEILDSSFGTISPKPTEKYEPLNKIPMKLAYTPMYRTDNLDKNLYLSNQPSVSEPARGGVVVNDGNFNRASYVIKHYRDFINEAAKSEDEKSEEYTYTEPPVRGVTVNEMVKLTSRGTTQDEEDYEYDVKFRKDIMNRFVDNFNLNSDRFKVDFPILYNSSVVHRQTPERGRVASSSTFMKRLYEVNNARQSTFLPRPCDPNCDKTVELSPAYELHYYVPDEEEKEEIEPRPTPPYRYRL